MKIRFEYSSKTENNQAQMLSLAVFGFWAVLKMGLD